MKALSLTQPWATLIAIGAKHIETRSWWTAYRGPLAIHASKAMPHEARSFAYADPAGRLLNEAGLLLGGDCAALPRGAIVAVAQVMEVYTTEALRALRLTVQERDLGDYRPGRFGFLLGEVRPLHTAVACRGALGLWEVPADVARAVSLQASRSAPHPEIRRRDLEAL